jgi:hypothetical protein
MPEGISVEFWHLCYITSDLPNHDPASAHLIIITRIEILVNIHSVQALPEFSESLFASVIVFFILYQLSVKFVNTNRSYIL